MTDFVLVFPLPFPPPLDSLLPFPLPPLVSPLPPFPLPFPLPPRDREEGGKADTGTSDRTLRPPVDRGVALGLGLGDGLTREGEAA